MLRIVAFLGAATVGVSALPAPQSSDTAAIANACAQVSQASASFLAENPQGVLDQDAAAATVVAFGVAFF